jgi:Tfp pilus assembly protein PilE
MGQQQLLLIVLGVIIVGIAVVVGINVFTASSANANREAVVADLTNLASLAQQYYRKPTALGGGNNAFTGWTVPGNLAQTPNMSAAVTATVTATTVTLVGVGNQTGNDGTTNVKVTMVVGANVITSTTVNN